MATKKKTRPAKGARPKTRVDAGSASAPRPSADDRRAALERPGTTRCRRSTHARRRACEKEVRGLLKRNRIGTEGRARPSLRGRAAPSSSASARRRHAQLEGRFASLCRRACEKESQSRPAAVDEPSHGALAALQHPEPAGGQGADPQGRRAARARSTRSAHAGSHGGVRVGRSSGALRAGPRENGVAQRQTRPHEESRSSAPAAASPAPSTRSAACARSRSCSTAASSTSTSTSASAAAPSWPRSLASGVSPREMYDEVASRAPRARSASPRRPLFRLGARRVPEALAPRARASSRRPLLDSARAARAATCPTSPGRSSSCCPPACSTTPGMQEYLAARLPQRAGRADSLRRPARASCYIVAVDLDSGEAVAFGDEGHRDVPDLAGGAGLDRAARPLPPGAHRRAATTWTAASRRPRTSTSPSSTAPTS